MEHVTKKMMTPPSIRICPLFDELKQDKKSKKLQKGWAKVDEMNDDKSCLMIKVDW